ncbi:MAG: KilA-N domain-containing protein [Bacteroidota bacterium]
MSKISVDGKEINLTTIDEREYVSLTDMVGDRSEANDIITNWMRTVQTLDFLAEWELMFNPDFNDVEYHVFRDKAGTVRLTVSPSKWIERTQAVGLIVKKGRYGGTFAHPDIAFEFGGRISPKFKILIIREYQRMKIEEAKGLNKHWDYSRFLSKVNYHIHTEAIRENILPRLEIPKNRAGIVYATEADLLNLATFGMTAKEWRESNPELAKKGNLRDFADITQLNVLANLESLNAVLIDQGASKEARFELLSKTAISQYQRLANQEHLKYIEE